MLWFSTRFHFEMQIGVSFSSRDTSNRFCNLPSRQLSFLPSLESSVSYFSMHWRACWKTLFYNVLFTSNTVVCIDFSVHNLLNCWKLVFFHLGCSLEVKARCAGFIASGAVSTLTGNLATPILTSSKLYLEFIKRFIKGVTTRSQFLYQHLVPSSPNQWSLFLLLLSSLVCSSCTSTDWYRPWIWDDFERALFSSNIFTC